ncbi:uncharacterized protein BX663DRAFT_523077 [Cokeromyces recurvatus]|uniref:uncharacterized protein n=1 Tax=Cokeromyces recurvatus TaxID=90255 RepID=UPI00221E440E|nr:uncharacterized protein BX663DRAFT_523077 [Cokeromyces recurvatus]KAI7898861.1 hypothetical protein BX663DRAFT_523077 [Cokeromyces recurvatus]
MTTQFDLKNQLEFYFSRQNLINDTYLVSQMDSELYVPISLVANFTRIREHTTDMSLIIKTLKSSSAVIVDETETKVKPNISLKRNTVILRDVPECTEEEINELLRELDSPLVQSIKQDIGNMWYFTFETEEDALKLLLSVRGKTFKGQDIAARMKSEPILRIKTNSDNLPGDNISIYITSPYNKSTNNKLSLKTNMNTTITEDSKNNHHVLSKDKVDSTLYEKPSAFPIFDTPSLPPLYMGYYYHPSSITSVPNTFYPSSTNNKYTQVTRSTYKRYNSHPKGNDRKSLRNTNNRQQKSRSELSSGSSVSSITLLENNFTQLSISEVEQIPRKQSTHHYSLRQPLYRNHSHHKIHNEQQDTNKNNKQEKNRNNKFDSTEHRYLHKKKKEPTTRKSYSTNAISIKQEVMKAY